MKTLAALGFVVFMLWAWEAFAAPCTVGVPFDEDGCQTTTPSNPQGDWQIMAFHLCEEKRDAETSCATAGEVADPDFDLVADAVGIPQRVQFSIDDATTCTAGTVAIIGRNVSNGDDHLIGTLEVGVGNVDSIIVSEWRHQFVTAVIADLAGCVNDTFNVGMRLYYAKITR